MTTTYLHRFNDAIGRRHAHSIDQRLGAADRIWANDRCVTDPCRKDAGVNHLKKKIWTLYSILVDQLIREGEDAIFLQAVEPDIDMLSDDISDELLDSFIDLSIEGVEEFSFEMFITLFEATYRKHLSLLLKRAEKDLLFIQDLLRSSMFSGNNLAELKKMILDLSMYPNAYAMGAYKVTDTATEFSNGRITAKETEAYSFHRLNPWNVFPEEPSSSGVRSNNYFVVEEYCEESLAELKDMDGSNSANIQSIIDDGSQYGMNWYKSNCANFPDLDFKKIPVVKFIGYEKGKFVEAWFVGDKDIYKAKGKDDAASVFTSSFRHNNDIMFGSGTVDTGWRLQKTIDKLSGMMVDNIGYRSTPGGMIAQSLAKHIPKNSRGERKLDYKKIIPIPDDLWRAGFTIRSFDVPDRSQQLQVTINLLKNEMDSVLGIPAFADGSQSVGTVGRSYQGMFLVQSNMMLGIKSVWNAFAEEIIVKMAERIINGNMLSGEIKQPLLDFSVRVKPFYMKEESLKDADGLIKEVQAVVALQEAGLVPQGAESELVSQAMKKLGVNTDSIQPEIETPQTPDTVSRGDGADAGGNIFE